MTRRSNHTITISNAAPMASEVAERRGIISRIDRHKRKERRRIRRQERLAWVREAEPTED